MNFLFSFTSVLLFALAVAAPTLSTSGTSIFTSLETDSFKSSGSLDIEQASLRSSSLILPVTAEFPLSECLDTLVNTVISANSVLECTLPAGMSEITVPFTIPQAVSGNRIQIKGQGLGVSTLNLLYNTTGYELPASSVMGSSAFTGLNVWDSSVTFIDFTMQTTTTKVMVTAMRALLEVEEVAFAPSTISDSVAIDAQFSKVITYKASITQGDYGIVCKSSTCDIRYTTTTCSDTGIRSIWNSAVTVTSGNIGGLINAIKAKTGTVNFVSSAVTLTAQQDTQSSYGLNVESVKVDIEIDLIILGQLLLKGTKLHAWAPVTVTTTHNNYPVFIGFVSEATFLNAVTVTGSDSSTTAMRVYSNSKVLFFSHVIVTGPTYELYVTEHSNISCQSPCVYGNINCGSPNVCTTD